eukprot:6003732-Alexandrium_andersonii.AAC.1
MSASLVGSEMCIRDRPRSAAEWGPQRLPIPKPPGKAVSPPWAPWDCGPVSYTHLTLPTICSV